jgi:uncharacterized coiled-coil DUF342 family protein
MRALHYFNLLGVVALAVLCAFQWRINRELNLHTNRLEKDRIDQRLHIEEQQEQIHARTADLDSFRESLQRAAADLKAAESNFFVSRRESAQLTLERDQLKESVAEWSQAVAERDKQLLRLSDQLQELAAERNDVVLKYNSLAEKHNETVQTLNDRIREFNTLVERYNTLAKSASKSN